MRIEIFCSFCNGSGNGEPFEQHNYNHPSASYGKAHSVSTITPPCTKCGGKKIIGFFEFDINAVAAKFAQLQAEKNSQL